MRIELEKLAESGGRFSQIYQGPDLGFDEAELKLLEPIKVESQIWRKNDEVDFRGELHTKIAVPCGRCLKPVELPIEVTFAERLVPSVSWRDEHEHELRAEDLNLGVFDGEAIELDDLVKEEILLAVPGHVLCREECKGLCPLCGADRNLTDCRCETRQIDSRWEKLRDLRF